MSCSGLTAVKMDRGCIFTEHRELFCPFSQVKCRISSGKCVIVCSLCFLSNQLYWLGVNPRALDCNLGDLMKYFTRIITGSFIFSTV